MKLKKDTFYSRAKEKIKNKGLVYASAGVIAACTGLVFFAKDCGHGTGAPMVETVRGDGVCHPELEAYPYLLDSRSGDILRDGSGAPLPNPNYSKEDCYIGDGVCDNATDAASLRNPAGQPVVLRDPRNGARIDHIQYLPRRGEAEGRRINLPLEGETDADCIRQLVREKGCSPLDRANPVYIDRPLVRSKLIPAAVAERSPDGSRVLAYMLPPTLVQRPMEGENSVPWIHLNPRGAEGQASSPSGIVWATQMIYARDELCPESNPDPNILLCTPDTITACYCPNLRGCEPAQDPCGNGTIDRGETCDPRATPSGCRSGQTCAPGCKRCQRGQNTCGNGTIDRDRGEVCDSRATPNGCGQGERCAPGCMSCEAAARHSECRNEQCVSVAGAGQDGCSSNEDCAAPPPPPPPQATPCDGSVLSRLRRAALNSLTAIKDQVRSAVTATPQQSVGASVPIAVSGGVPRVTGSVTLSGPGSGSVSGSSVDLSSVSFTPDVNCTGTVTVTVSGDN